MKTSTFSFYSDKKTLTIDKIKFIKPTEDFNRPRTGLWLAKKNLWKNTWDGGSNYAKQIKYQYKVKVDMKDIFLLTIDNFQDFFKLYKKNYYDNINWTKFIKNNPSCKGIYLTFNPMDDKLYNNIKLPLGPKLPPISEEKKQIMLKYLKSLNSNAILDTRSIPYVRQFIASWLISSICVWDKSAILDFKLFNENK